MNRSLFHLTTAGILAALCSSNIRAQQAPERPRSSTQPALGARAVPILERRGLRFKDLNSNGQLDPYEDWRNTPAVRARDLVGRMTIDEKAGVMMHGTDRKSVV